MQARTTARDKTSTPAPSSSFAPLGQAVLESFSEGVVVFDAYGRMLYANQRARRVIDALDGNGGGRRGEGLRERLIAFGGRGRSLKQGSLELGEAVFLPDGDHVRTLAERERQAILVTLESTHGKLAETARRLGISRTTLCVGCGPTCCDRTGTEGAAPLRAPSAQARAASASRSGHAPGSHARQAIHHRGLRPLVRRGLRGDHLLRLLRPLLRDRGDRAVPRVRARLRAGIRSLRHFPAAQGRPQRVLLAGATRRPAAGR